MNIQKQLIALLLSLGFLTQTSLAYQPNFHMQRQTQEALAHQLDTYESKQIKNAWIAYNQHDYVKAFNKANPLAKKGNVSAQGLLAVLYLKGLGVSQSDKKAMYWFRKAADQGNATAQYSLGIMYTNGYGVAQNEQLASQWYRKAADQNHSSAQFYLGGRYEQGRGVEQNYDEALKWYNKAFASGHVDAGSNIVRLTQEITAAKAQRNKPQPVQFVVQSKPNSQDEFYVLLAQKPAATINKKRWLFVIGIENYRKTDSILYSRNSAETFSKVASHTLGIHPSRRVVLLDEQASGGAIQDELRLMLRKVREGDEVYFYYSGHGLPVPEEGNAPYLLPSDKIPDFIAEDAFYKAESIYRLLEDSKASSVIAFMDACFTGQTDGKSIFMGTKAATRLQPKKIGYSSQGKLAIITAGTNKQFSNAYQEKEHRLFTYYLMHSMLTGKYKNIGRLSEKVRSDVYDKSLDLGGLNEQSPVFTGNPDLQL